LLPGPVAQSLPALSAGQVTDYVLDWTASRTGRAVDMVTLPALRSLLRFLRASSCIPMRHSVPGSGGNSERSFRQDLLLVPMWIVPGEVEVHVVGDALYILKAPLNVKTESEYLGDSLSCPRSDPVTEARNEELERVVIEVPPARSAKRRSPGQPPCRYELIDICLDVLDHTWINAAWGNDPPGRARHRRRCA
jgi:hypothetical protein